MGYCRPAKVYKIVWDDGDLAGFEVRARGLSVGKLLELGKAAAEVPDDFSGSIASMEPLITEFAGALIEWNLENEDGSPVPVTVDGIRQQDMSLVIPAVMRWMTAVAGVDNPLPGTLNSGGTSPEASLALASSSSSQQN